MGAKSNWKTSENQVSSRPNQEAAAPRKTEVSIKYLFSRKTQHLRGGLQMSNGQISDNR